MSKIILIDDDDLLRESIKSLLQSKGHEIFDADNGLSGLQLIKQNKPDIIITDIVMPEMDGLTLMGKISELNSSAKVIALSGEIHPENAVFNDIVKRVADVILSKPASVDEIISHVS